MCKVLIEIEGEVTKVVTDREMDIVVIYRDQAMIPTVEKCDITILPGSEKLSKQYGESIDCDDSIIYEKLKELGL